MRYYSAELGRWNRRDTLGEVIDHKDGQTETNLLYGFVNNDSINNWDLIGELTQSGIGDVLEAIENLANKYAGSQKYNLKGVAAEELLYGTAIVESGLRFRIQFGGGPALGLFQMEPATHNDIWTNYLKYKPHLKCAISIAFTPAGGQLNAQTMVQDDDYATIMARVHYLRVPSGLPAAGDLKAQAMYWKKYYNTLGGKGTVKKYIYEWMKFHGQIL